MNTKSLRAILLYGIRRQTSDDVSSNAKAIEHGAMICSEYRIMPVYYGDDTGQKAAFFAIEESIHEIPLFGEAESITLRDEKVDATWTDRLRRTFTDLGLEWRTPSWHLEVISCSEPYIDKDGRLKPEHLESELLKSLRSPYLDTEASVDDKFLKSCIPGNAGEVIDWFGGAPASAAKRRFEVSKQLRESFEVDLPEFELTAFETNYVGGVRWEITRIDHPTLQLKEGFEIDFNFERKKVEGPIEYSFTPTDDHLVEYKEVQSYVDKLVRRCLYLFNQLGLGVNLDYHDDWQAIKDLFEERS